MMNFTDVRKTHLVDLIIYPGFKSFEAVGPLTVFSVTNRILISQGLPEAYKVRIVAPFIGYIPSDTLMNLQATECLSDSGYADTCLLVGSADIYTAIRAEPEIVDWARSAASYVPRLAALCTGAFFFAASGVLDELKATTHWRYADSMQARYPLIKVDSDAIFIQQGNLWTSAGVSAAIDLCLAFVEDDCGKEIALEVARELVIFLKRPGGQSQYSTDLGIHKTQSNQIRESQEWILDNLDKKINVGDLAAACSMSERNYRRVFHKETDQCPTEFIEKARIESAKRLLVSSDLPLKSVAFRCGFSTDDQMRSTFQKHLTVSPKEYRQSFY